VQDILSVEHTIR